jgi:hypothetical protein
MSDEACLFLGFVSSIIWWCVALSSRAPTADERRCAFCGLPFSLCDSADHIQTPGGTFPRTNARTENN